jgi:hypothetical protein
MESAVLHTEEADPNGKFERQVTENFYFRVLMKQWQCENLRGFKHVLHIHAISTCRIIMQNNRRCGHIALQIESVKFLGFVYNLGLFFLKSLHGDE